MNEIYFEASKVVESYSVFYRRRKRIRKNE
jgi:hypothetical protein